MRCGAQVDIMNVYDGWGDSLRLFDRGEKGVKLLPLGHPDALPLIVMVTPRLVGALAIGKEDQ